MLAAAVLGCSLLTAVPASAAASPSVTITSPAKNTAYTAPASITISASASESGGTISKVEFFGNGSLLSTDTKSPYSYTAANVAAGSYSLTAEAFDSRGRTATSAAVPVTVTNAVISGGTNTAPQLHVSGNELLNASGTQVVLHGVDRSGTEYECLYDGGFFDGPSNQASITAMKSWGINAVRIPLNEACWNGESYVPAADAGANYQAAIEAYVNLLNANGMVAILDLQWTDGLYVGLSTYCASSEAICQKPMPDTAESVPFWKSVATAFKSNSSAVFDLFNEPFPEEADGYNETEAWQCWLNGGSSCVGISYSVAGMQTLVNTIRATGSNNVIMAGGISWANDLTQWLKYQPTGTNITASWHSYNFGGCVTQSCWNSQIAPVIAKVPVITGEIGEDDCLDTYINPLMTWLDSEHTSYLAWTWDAWAGMCATGPALITDYNGDPTTYGAGYEAHLQSLTAGTKSGGTKSGGTSVSGPNRT